ncbi:FluC/FEX family fluoride channel [Streptomyces mesophilus]|uniref:FluC/FEX family fluoride channel n=1 Tax=Streptomyces mesophilus TaxID=1775132 RepID=UPI0033179907
MLHDREADGGPRSKPRPAPVLAAVALGGGLGATARYAAALLWPTGPEAFPWTTLWVNVIGCALIGVLMVAVTETGRPAPALLRPFLGTGVLGGFTTFSTYVVDIQRLIDHDHSGTALAYLAATLAAALVAVSLAAAAARKALGVPA